MFQELEDHLRHCNNVRCPHVKYRYVSSQAINSHFSFLFDNKVRHRNSSVLHWSFLFSCMFEKVLHLFCLIIVVCLILQNNNPPSVILSLCHTNIRASVSQNWHVGLCVKQRLVSEGLHRPGKVLEFDLGPGKHLEFQNSAICP